MLDRGKEITKEQSWPPSGFVIYLGELEVSMLGIRKTEASKLLFLCYLQFLKTLY